MKNYFQAPWSLRELITALFISAVMIFAASFLLTYTPFSGNHEDSNYKSLYILAALILQWLLILGPVLFLGRKHKPTLADFGFKRIGILKTFGLVISSYLLYLGISLIIGILIFYYDLRVPGYQIQESLVPIFGTDPLNIVIALITVVVIAPLIEEILFRGFILRTLVNKIGLWWGSILSALAFSALHIPWQSFIPIFILGLVINSIVLRGKSLWPAIIFHAINNGIAFTVQILIATETISLESVV